MNCTFSTPAVPTTRALGPALPARQAPPLTSARAGQRVIIWKTDQFHADTLRRATQSVWPSATIQHARRASEVTATMATGLVDLLLTGLSSEEGDVLDFLSANLAGPRPIRRVLIVTDRPDQHALAVLRTLPIAGVFDTASEDSAQFERALRAIVSDGAYWSPSVVAYLTRQCLSPHSLYRQLTPTERLVLAVLGDGSDDKVAANRLGLRPATILSIRRDLYRKLGVHHRGELMRVAAQSGLVRFTPEGVKQSGFAIVLTAWQAQKKRRDGEAAAADSTGADQSSEIAENPSRSLRDKNERPEVGAKTGT